MLGINKIILEKEYLVEIYLTNGHRIVYDLFPRLNTARFYHMDEALFKKGQLVNGNMIHWDDSTELSLEEILYDISDLKPVFNKRHA